MKEPPRHSFRKRFSQKCYEPEPLRIVARILCFTTFAIPFTVGSTLFAISCVLQVICNPIFSHVSRRYALHYNTQCPNWPFILRVVSGKFLCGQTEPKPKLSQMIDVLFLDICLCGVGRRTPASISTSSCWGTVNDGRRQTNMLGWPVLWGASRSLLTLFCWFWYRGAVSQGVKPRYATIVYLGGVGGMCPPSMCLKMFPINNCTSPLW